MARQSILYALLSLALLPLSSALKFDLAAHTGRERCIRNFVAKDTLVLVTAIVDGQKGDGQQVNMHVGASRLQHICVQGQLVLTLRAPTADQGRRGQRVRTTEGHCGRDENGVHVARGRCVRRVL